MRTVRTELPTDQKKDKTLPVIEIFGPTVQGEGALIGQQTMFVRLGYCDYRCSWCDSMYAVDPRQVKETATWMTPRQIVSQMSYPCPWVTLSGGNPVLHDCSELVHLLHERGFKVAVETQGTIYRDWVVDCDIVTVSPKPPSSGMNTDWDQLRVYAMLQQSNLKVVVFDETDFEYAREVRRRFPFKTLYLQVGNQVDDDDVRSLVDRLKWLSDMTLGSPDMSEAVVLPQLHVLIWGNARGV